MAKNPTYTELIKQRKVKQEQKLQRYEGLERKLLKETGSVPLSLKQEIDFIKCNSLFYVTGKFSEIPYYLKN